MTGPSIAGSRLLVALTVVVAMALMLASGATAKTIDVRAKGPFSDVLQKAIDKAKPGDSLRVHAGRYPEAVSVDKRLKIFAAPGPRPVIDAKCNSSIAINVTSPGVSLAGLQVKGTLDAFAINFIGLDSGRVDDMRMNNNCGRAQYGVNVFDSGKIRITNSRATGFVDSGIYIGGIQDTSKGALIVRNNVATDNNRGVIVEDSSGVDVRIQDNVLDHNTYDGDLAEGTPSGIFVNNSDGILFENNETNSNGQYGILVNETSDNNVFRRNESNDNPVNDIFDQGSGNCGSGNSFSLPSC